VPTFGRALESRPVDHLGGVGAGVSAAVDEEGLEAVARPRTRPEDRRAPPWTRRIGGGGAAGDEDEIRQPGGVRFVC
jgi:hypothetical protein